MPTPVPATEAPATGAPTLSEVEKRTSAALMRVNHAGEVAAQALYHGQALVARSAATRDLLLKAAREETDHLAWCETRLKELNSRPSLLNPLWYAGSFTIGAVAALMGDRASLGFVVERSGKWKVTLMSISLDFRRMTPAAVRYFKRCEPMKSLTA